MSRPAGEVGIDDIGERGAIGPWLVLDFEDDVVEAIGFDDQLARVFFLKFEDVSVFEGVEFLPVDVVGAVDVVRGIQRADLPHHFVVVRREETDFDDDSAL